MSGADCPPVLFDLDGTLIATRRLYLEAFADALEPVLDRRATHDEMMALRPRAEARFLREVGGHEAHPEVMTRFWAAYETRHGADFEGIYPEVPELLARLRDQGLALGLVTGKSRRTWELTRPHVEGALGSFDVQVFDDDVPAPKPDPAGILLALKALGALGARSEGCVYVGDTGSDLESRPPRRSCAGRGSLVEAPARARGIRSPRPLPGWLRRGVAARTSGCPGPAPTAVGARLPTVRNRRSSPASGRKPALPLHLPRSSAPSTPRPQTPRPPPGAPAGAAG